MSDADQGEVDRSDRLVIRAWAGVAALTLLLAGFFGFVAWLGFDAAASAVSVGTAIGALAILIGGLVTIRAARSALIADGEGITIRNAWTTRRWTWNEIGEVGWDGPFWARGGIGAISVCPLGDRHTHKASGTATGGDEFQRHARLLAPVLARHGVTNALDRDTAAVQEWWADPRSHTRPRPEREG